MKCHECGKQMEKIDRRTEMVELESSEDVTEGQFADYLAAQESGDFGEWAQGVVEYLCHSCGVTVELASDHLADYDALIRNWHAKTKQGDYLSKYVFEYLAFMAFLKSYIAIGSATERAAIQTLKCNEQAKRKYLTLIGNDSELRKVLSSLIRELKREPLHNSSKDYDYPEIDNWWNSSGINPDLKSKRKKGAIHSLRDWGNIVEFWYGIRNNLFHGGKDPSVVHDQFLVEHAFKTLSQFVKILLNEP